ncbi:FAD-dependent monooxygenase [Dactylosporangium sp. CA-092794]|uniref:FAD-dependent monooxygenase n=1 Tax=Dactylosporangium sp. CA-092794 TaxID=3239929 RepID=UPI003D8AFB9F
MKALVVGCGIAGSVTAVALQRAGIAVTVCEAYDRSADGVGAYLSLTTNGLSILDELGLLREVVARGFTTPRLVVSTFDGKELGTLSYGAPLRDGTAAQTLRRADLYQVLRDACARTGAQVVYGKRLVGAETGADGVVARFADGSTEHADVLIGADGLRSVARRIIDPDAPALRYTGVTETGGYARGLRLDAEPGVLRLIYGRGGLFCYIPHPDGEVWWFTQPPSKAEPDRDELAATPQDVLRARILAQVAGDRGPAARIIEATEEILRPWAGYDMPSLRTWRRGRMVLVGDAAHAASPASGQGASMALEDALVLAKCLRDVDGVPQALAEFETRRRDRVERVVAHGKRNGDLGVVGRIAAPLVFRHMIDVRWMTEFRETWAAPARR